MNENELLKQFSNAIEKAMEDKDSKLDIEKLLNTRQMKIFTLYEEIVGQLFSGKNLQDGLVKVIDGRGLTQTEQVTVLMFLKLFESFTSSFGQLQEMPNIPRMDGGMYA